MPPNIVLITCDQLRKCSLGCYGNDVVQTPNIDRIADQGVRFENAFTAYPVCAPNRASLATGRYPTIHGLCNNGVFLPKEELTLMEVLRQRGYATYGVGKMHFGPQWRFTNDGSPLKDPTPEMAVDPQPEPWEMPWHGFDQVAITEDHRVGPYADYLAEHGYDTWQDPHSFTYPQHISVQSAYPEEHHQSTWIGDRTMAMMEEHADDQPFFMWMSFVHPHHPFNPPAPYDTMYDPADMPLPIWDEAESEFWPFAYQRKYSATEGGHEAIGMYKLTNEEWQRVRAFYYGMISLIDKQVGRLLDWLEETGQMENTIFCFSADHGEMLGDHHLVFKGTTFDQVTNVPLIVSTPEGRGAGQTGVALCNTVDIMPTLLELAGIPTPDSVQGVSIEPGLDDGQWTPRAATLIENQGVRRSVRTMDKLLTWHGPNTQGELYDLCEDPNCLRNLWNQPEAAELQKELMDTLMLLMAQNVDPLPPRVGAC